MAVQIFLGFFIVPFDWRCELERTSGYVIQIVTGIENGVATLNGLTPSEELL